MSVRPVRARHMRALLLMALADRLIQAGSDGDCDGLVLASAGSSSREAAALVRLR